MFTVPILGNAFDGNLRKEKNHMSALMKMTLKTIKTSEKYEVLEVKSNLKCKSICFRLDGPGWWSSPDEPWSDLKQLLCAVIISPAVEKNSLDRNTCSWHTEIPLRLLC